MVGVSCKIKQHGTVFFMRIVCSSRVSPLTLKYVTVGDCDLFNVCMCRSVALDSADPRVRDDATTTSPVELTALGGRATAPSPE